jgi:hypothetical protein
MNGVDNHIEAQYSAHTEIELVFFFGNTFIPA